MNRKDREAICLIDKHLKIDRKGNLYLPSWFLEDSRFDFLNEVVIKDNGYMKIERQTRKNKCWLEGSFTPAKAFIDLLLMAKPGGFSQWPEDSSI